VHDPEGSHYKRGLPCNNMCLRRCEPLFIVIASRRRGNLRKAKLKNQRAKISQKSKVEVQSGKEFLHFEL